MILQFVVEYRGLTYEIIAKNFYSAYLVLCMNLQNPHIKESHVKILSVVKLQS